MKKTHARLRLATETIRPLTSAQLDGVGGGTFNYNNYYSYKGTPSLQLTRVGTLQGPTTVSATVTG